MSRGYIVRCIALFFVVIWAAASINFFIPRMATGRDPIREKLGQLAATGGLRQAGVEAMVKAYQPSSASTNRSTCSISTFSPTPVGSTWDTRWLTIRPASA